MFVATEVKSLHFFNLPYNIGISILYVINYYCLFGPPPILFSIGLRHLYYCGIGGLFISWRHYYSILPSIASELDCSLNTTICSPLRIDWKKFEKANRSIIFLYDLYNITDLLYFSVKSQPSEESPNPHNTNSVFPPAGKVDATKESLSPIFVASEQGLDVSR